MVGVGKPLLHKRGWDSSNAWGAAGVIMGVQLAGGVVDGLLGLRPLVRCCWDI